MPSAIRHGGKGKGGGKSGKWMATYNKTKSVQRKPYKDFIATAGIPQSTRSSRDHLRKRCEELFEQVATNAYYCAKVAGRKTITQKDMLLAISLTDNSNHQFVSQCTYKSSKRKK